MGFLPGPNLPCHADDQSQSRNLGSNSSSFNSFLSSQSSLLSIPSLTPSTQQNEHPAPACHHLSTLKGHYSYIFSLALTGKHLYSGSSNGEIRVWSRDPSSSAPVNPLSNTVAEGYSAVKSILILGDKMFSAHQDHKIRVWKIDHITPYQKYKGIATLPTVNDRCMRLFSAKNYIEVRRHKKCTWVHHVDTIAALALSRDGSLLYSVSWDRTFKVWKTSNFDCLESMWNAHDDAINAIVVSNDAHVYTGSADKKIKVWKKNEGEKKHSLVATLEKHKSAVNALALTIDGSILYSGAGSNGSIIVWEKDGSDGRHMTVAGALKGHNKAILCLTVVSNFLCSGSADKTVRIWRREIGKSHSLLAVFEGHKGPVKCLAAAVDNNHTRDTTGSGTSYLIYSGSLDFDVRVWQIWVPPF
ncbi:vegetative incompatibility HET-E-1-like [Olea europaea subsp. europaea]|uniref:Vegetative incompatibility HET-E-1-like n=1 Tax=Olea europaea subsp. europaea TaxID=158383 RepID=A0A8S0T8N7_OLEEU|nr:vegetative incompatibility HET-E-1-like [Olea europaea subsp. europaea]